jgi:hypothetical protein
MATNSMPRHNRPRPVPSAAPGSFLPAISMSAFGTRLTTANIMPIHRAKRPGQPQSRTAITVATIPVVLLSIVAFSCFDPRLETGDWRLVSERVAGVRRIVLLNIQKLEPANVDFGSLRSAFSVLRDTDYSKYIRGIASC